MGHAEMVNLRMGVEVVEGAESGDDGSQRGGNVGFAGVSVMVLPMDAIAMDFGMERLGHQARSAAKVHKQAAGGYAVQRKSMLREPLGDLADVFARRPELRAELLRR